MTELSPKAQAVINAAWEKWDNDLPCNYEYIADPVAAALRAAADQVVPGNYASFTGHIEWDQGMETRNDSIRDELLAIAAELEGSNA